MSDHLPECPVDVTVNYRVDCICSALRACEQRVTRSKERVIQEAEFNYRRGVQAARDAVAALESWDDEVLAPEVWVSRDAALAAIDALTTQNAAPEPGKEQA